MKLMYSPPDPQVVNYILRVKKVAEKNCELLGHCLVFEAEMNAWIDSLEKEKEEEQK